MIKYTTIIKKKKKHKKKGVIHSKESETEETFQTFLLN